MENINKNIDDTREEVLNPDFEAMQTGGSAQPNRRSNEEEQEIHGSADRATVPLTNRKMEMDKKEREKEMERVEREKGNKQHKKEERQKEWGE